MTLDSVENGFKLRKVSLGFELGRSPSHKPTTFERINRMPFMKATLSWSHLVGETSYFISSVGLSWEEVIVSSHTGRVTNIVFIDSIANNGTKMESWSRTYRAKRVSYVIDLCMRNYEGIFKNKNAYAGWQIGLTIKPLLWGEVTSWSSHYKDSLSIVLVSEQNKKNVYTSTIGSDYPTDIAVHCGPAMLFDTKVAQHQLGLDFSLQATFTHLSYAYYSGAYIRLFYNLGIKWRPLVKSLKGYVADFF
jgi:hypothetical protein